MGVNITPIVVIIEDGVVPTYTKLRRCMLTTLLLIVALILAILSVVNVPSKFNLLGAAVITTIIALLLPSATRLL